MCFFFKKSFYLKFIPFWEHASSMKILYPIFFSKYTNWIHLLTIICVKIYQEYKNFAFESIIFGLNWFLIVFWVLCSLSTQNSLGILKPFPNYRKKIKKIKKLKKKIEI